MIDGVKIYAAALNLAEIRNEYACSRPWRIIFRSTGGGTELAWNYPHPYQTMQLLQNEEVIAEFPGDAEIESFVLEDSPEPGTVFQLRAIRADGSEELSQPAVFEGDDSSEGAPQFRRGDYNDDGQVDLSDATATLGYLFTGADEPGCFQAADTTADGTVNIAGAVVSLNFLFLGGTALPAPGPYNCGSADGPLDCQSYSSCD